MLEMVFLAGVGGVILAEHILLAGRLRRYELLRRALGIGTVMGLALLLVPAGIVHWRTWLLILAGFAVAGLATVSGYIVRALYARPRIERAWQVILMNEPERLNGHLEVERGQARPDRK